MVDLRVCRHGVMGPSTRRILMSILFAIFFYLFATYTLCPNKVQRRSVNAEECTKWRPSSDILDAANLQNPQIKLNPRKFLLPLLYNGPTNQIWGMRQAAYVAILLNRTLVLPLFHKHLVDDSGPENIIDASHRFQVDSLSRLMSVVSLEEYYTHCGKSIDVVFQATGAREWTVNSLKIAENELNLEFLHRSSKGVIKRSEPFLPKVKVKSPFMAHAENKRIIQRAYQSDEKCALYQFPFREIKMEVDRNHNQDEYEKYTEMLSQSIEDIPTWFLVNSLFQSMLPPKYIQDISEQFLNHIFSQRNYIAIHWRYDDEDFRKFMCAKEAGNPNQAEMCRKVNQITPESLGKSMADYVTHIKEKSSEDIRLIYIATPRTESTLKFLHQLTNDLTSKNLKVVTQDDFENFVENVELKEACPFLDENYNDVLSLVEMEICSRSSVFLRSVYSSWSDSVMLNRDMKHIKQTLRRFDIATIRLPGLVE